MLIDIINFVCLHSSPFSPYIINVLDNPDFIDTKETQSCFVVSIRHFIKLSETLQFEIGEHSGTHSANPF